MTDLLDFSGADSNDGNFELIPNGTVVPVIYAVVPGEDGTPEKAYKFSNDGSLMMLKLEATVTEGQYKGRKIWVNFNLAGTKGSVLSDGQQKSINIARAALRSILEAGRKVDPTDESPAAMKARTLTSVRELDGLEGWVTVGVQQSKDPRYSDQNVIKRYHPYKSASASDAAGGAGAAPQVSAPARTGQAPGRASGAGAAPKKPSWA